MRENKLKKAEKSLVYYVSLLVVVQCFLFLYLHDIFACIKILLLQHLL